MVDSNKDGETMQAEEITDEVRAELNAQFRKETLEVKTEDISRESDLGAGFFLHNKRYHVLIKDIRTGTKMFIPAELVFNLAQALTNIFDSSAEQHGTKSQYYH